MTTAVTKVSRVKSLLTSEAMKKQFAMALPSILTPERFIRVAMTTISRTPALAECTQESLLTALMDCAALGLEPNGRDAHLIPYAREATLLVDFKGKAQVVRRSGEVQDIHADVVYDNDKFEYELGNNGRLTHSPCLKGPQGEPYAAYSFVTMKDGSTSVHVMRRDEIEKIRDDFSAGWRNVKKRAKSPWSTRPGEMWKKTVFHGHCKWLPFSPELKEVLLKGDDSILSEFDITGQVDVGPALKRPESTEKPSQTPVEDKAAPKTDTGKGKGKDAPETPPDKPETTLLELAKRGAAGEEELTDEDRTAFIEAIGAMDIPNGPRKRACDAAGVEPDTELETVSDVQLGKFFVALKTELG